MKEERKKTVKSVMKGNTEADIRGLEKYIDKSIRQAKQVAWDTVLIEQDEQELAGHFSAEKLAEVYKHYTRESPIKAAMKAKAMKAMKAKKAAAPEAAPKKAMKAMKAMKAAKKAMKAKK